MDTNLKIEPFANLLGANLFGANLGGADLRGANLESANLLGADLQGADLRGANLRGADLWDANLFGADLEGANLLGANLLGTNLEGANLLGAEGILAIGPIGSRGDILYIVRHADKKTLMFKTGCFWGTGKELLAAANDKHKIGHPITIQYRAAIRFAREVFKQWDLYRPNIPF